nr:hypothetical protein [Microlunatus sp. Gsoil 973]
MPPPTRTLAAARISGTAISTGIAKIANHSADISAIDRYRSPPSSPTPNQPVSGAMKPT